MPKEEKVIVSKDDYDILMFRKIQIDKINILADKLERGEIDGFDFGERVLNIL